MKTIIIFMWGYWEWFSLSCGVFSCSSVIENENGYRFQNSDFVYLFMLTDPDIKNAYFPNLQKYPKARLLFYPYIKKFPI